MPEARQLITEEMEYQVGAGFSEIVLWSNVQALQPKQLKVSPLPVIPQVNCRGRLLLDLSFAVHAPTNAAPLAPSVNDTTTKHSPVYPVKVIGWVLVRILRFMAAIPAEETIMFAKFDLSDGFWRMLVAKDCKWNFAYTLPAPAMSQSSLSSRMPSRWDVQRARGTSVRPQTLGGTFSKR